MILYIDDFIDKKARDLKKYMYSSKCKYAPWEGFWAAMELWPNLKSSTIRLIKQRYDDIEFEEMLKWEKI